MDIRISDRKLAEIIEDECFHFALTNYDHTDIADPVTANLFKECATSILKLEDHLQPHTDAVVKERHNG